MALENIPQIDKSVVETHYNDRYRSHEEFERFKAQMREGIQANESLDYIINVIAHYSEDPDSVYKTAYTILALINAQIEVNELNDSSELKCDRRER